MLESRLPPTPGRGRSRFSKALPSLPPQLPPTQRLPSSSFTVAPAAPTATATATARAPPTTAMDITNTGLSFHQMSSPSPSLSPSTPSVLVRIPVRKPVMPSAPSSPALDKALPTPKASFHPFFAAQQMTAPPSPSLFSKPPSSPLPPPPPPMSIPRRPVCPPKPSTPASSTHTILPLPKPSIESAQDSSRKQPLQSLVPSNRDEGSRPRSTQRAEYTDDDPSNRVSINSLLSAYSRSSVDESESLGRSSLEGGSQRHSADTAGDSYDSQTSSLGMGDESKEKLMLASLGHFNAGAGNGGNNDNRIKPEETQSQTQQTTTRKTEKGVTDLHGRESQPSQPAVTDVRLKDLSKDNNKDLPLPPVPAPWTWDDEERPPTPMKESGYLPALRPDTVRQDRPGTPDDAPGPATNPVSVDSSPRQQQQQLWFRRSVGLGRDLNLPHLKLADSNGSTAASQPSTLANVTTLTPSPLAPDAEPSSRPPFRHRAESLAPSLSEFPQPPSERPSPAIHALAEAHSVQTSSVPPPPTTPVRRRPVPSPSPASVPASAPLNAPETVPAIANSDTMGHEQSKLRTKLSKIDLLGQKQGGLKDLGQTAATNSAPNLPLPRLPTPDYEKEDVQTKTGLGDFASTISPATSPELPLKKAEEGDQLVEEHKAKDLNNKSRRGHPQSVTIMGGRDAVMKSKKSAPALRTEPFPSLESSVAIKDFGALPPLPKIRDAKREKESGKPTSPTASIGSIPSPILRNATPTTGGIPRSSGFGKAFLAGPGSRPSSSGSNYPSSFHQHQYRPSGAHPRGWAPRHSGPGPMPRPPDPSIPELRQEALPPPDPRALRFPATVAELFPAGYVFPALPLKSYMFDCHAHERFAVSAQKGYPVACQTCGKRDMEDRCRCPLCGLRICKACRHNLDANGRDLRKLVEGIEPKPQVAKLEFVGA